MKNIYSIAIKTIVIAAILAAFSPKLGAQSLVNLGASSVVRINDGAALKINGSLQMGAGSQINENGVSEIDITGDWTNNGGTVSPDQGTVKFTGTENSELNGTSGTNFNLVEIDKSGANDDFEMNQNMTLSGNLYVIDGDFLFDNTAGRELTVAGDLSIGSGSTMSAQTADFTHTFTIGGNIDNDNVFDMRNPDAGTGGKVNLIFDGSENSLIDHSGTTFDLYSLEADKTDISDEILISDAFTARDGFLTLTGGTLRISGTFAFTNTFFAATGGEYLIPENAGLWNENPNITVTGQDASGNLSGSLRWEGGAFNVGSAAFPNNRFLYSSGANPAEFDLDGGSFVIAERFSREGAGDLINYDQSGGIVTVGAHASSSTADRGIFDIGAAGSTFNWSAGTIELGRNSANASGDYYVKSGGSVTGGLLEIDAGATENFTINTDLPVGEFSMQSTNNPTVDLDADLEVLGDVTFAGTGGFDTDDFDIELGGDWNNNFASQNDFVAGTGRVTFDGTADQSLNGTETDFYHLEINGSNQDLEMNFETRIDGDLWLVSNSHVDMQTYDLTLGEQTVIYSDQGVTQVFGVDKCIINSGGATGGRLIKEMASVPTPNASDIEVRMPLGTPGVYTPYRFDFFAGAITNFGANPSVSVRCVDEEHPDVESNNVSLVKYWTVETNDLTFDYDFVKVTYVYDQTEVSGSEGNYLVLRHTSNWSINPGDGNFVIVGSNNVSCEYPPDGIDGDWTAGNIEAAIAFYYSRASGDWDDPTSWSKVSHVGPAATTYPTGNSDVVYVADGDTITVTSAPSQVNKVYVEEDGRLMLRTFQLTCDTFRLEAGGALGIGHAQGIEAGGANGAVLKATGNSLLHFDEEAIYIFTNNTDNQPIGDGVPSNVGAIVIDKTDDGDRCFLEKSITVKDSLVILSGELDLTNNLYNIDGQNPGAGNPTSYFDMRGGILTTYDNFPYYYQTCDFDAGEVRFRGSNPVYIPSGEPIVGEPCAVRQYYDLTIRDYRSYNSVRFSAQDTIRIGRELDISNLNFTFPTPHMITEGSTIVFNQDGGTQDIPRNTQRNNEDSRLYFHNLIISGSGVKRIIEGNQKCTGDFLLEGSEFQLNSRDITIEGDWTKTGGDFNPGTNTVIFDLSDAPDTNSIVSMDDPFYDVEITGAGAIRFDGDMTVSDILEIQDSDTYFIGGNATLSITGTGNSWQNNGVFSPGTSTVRFAADGDQTIWIPDDSTKQSFYNLTVDKASGYLQPRTNDTIQVNNNLDFVQGYIDAVGTREIKVDGTCSQSGGYGAGFVVGNMYRKIPTGTTGALFNPVGLYDSDFIHLPVTLTFDGTGGTAGYLNIDPNGAGAGDFTGSGLVFGQSPPRYWDIEEPGFSAFYIGNRTFDAIIGFPNSDIQGTGNPNNFQTRVWDTSIWHETETGNRTTSSTESLNNDILGKYIVGEPSYLVYYSVADGNWSDASSWSTASYSGGAASTTPSLSDSVRIGNGKTITLDADFQVGTGQAVVVEKAGPLDAAGTLETGTNYIFGPGAFTLKESGRLAIGHADGIRDVDNTGNIRCDDRFYNDDNDSNHGEGVFIYNGTADQVTGDGLPSDAKSLTIDNTGNTVDLTASVSLSEDLTIANGTFDVSVTNSDVSLGGDWTNDGTFTPGSGSETVTFDGSGDQNLGGSSTGDFNRLTLNKSAGSVVVADNDLEISTRLEFAAANQGTIDLRTNDLTLTILNGADVNRAGSGHVDGELIKYVPTGAQTINYEIGNSDDYTPAEIDISGTGGTAGYLGIVSNTPDHPNINAVEFNLATNVRRWWDLNPDASIALGARTYDLKMTFLYPDDIRGGADPTNFLTKFWDGSVWDSPADPPTAQQNYTIGNTIDDLDVSFAIGEGPGAQDVFYSIAANGNWEDGNSWSYGVYDELTPAGDFPQDANDIAYIGGDHIINMTSDKTVAAVIIETYGGDPGKLVMGTNVLNGTQFSLKDGGILSVGHADGIVQSGANGAIRTTIRDYNNNNHDNGNFAFTDNCATTGDGLPDVIASLEVSTSTSTSLDHEIEINGSMTISSGSFSANNNDIYISEDFFNNDVFTPTGAKVEFDGDGDSQIGGTSETSFNDLTINKTSGDLSLAQDATVDGTLDFAADALLKLDNYDLTIGESGSITGVSLGSNQMIQSLDQDNCGRLIKEHASGTGDRNFVFPIGIGNVYNPATINLTADFAAGAETALRLRSGEHPEKIGAANMLGKYWQIETSGVSNIQQVANTEFTFRYDITDENGDPNDYVPGVYNPTEYTPATGSNTGWEINLGTASSVNTGTRDVVVTEHTILDGDWTAGEKDGFFEGRIFYSIDDADWDDPSGWSHVDHNGPETIDIPGTFQRDTVYIGNGDEITLDFYGTGETTIGAMTIDDDGGGGELTFDANSSKRLVIKGDMIVESGGDIGFNNGGDRFDELEIWGDLENNTTGGDEVDLRRDNNEMVTLIFGGDTDSEIRGTGNWDLDDVEINKTDGLSSSVHNLSTSFSSELSSMVDGGQGTFALTSGMYIHDVTGTTILDQNGGSEYYMGQNSGIDLRQGTIWFRDDFHTNTNTEILISGGHFQVGSLDAGRTTNVNENFYYADGTTYRQSGGQFTVASCFTVEAPTSAIDFNLTGGTLTVMERESNQYGDIYGFGIKQNSIFVWNDDDAPSRIIYAQPSNGHLDYVVQADSFAVTGGTLQMGKADYYIQNTSKRHSMSSVTPIYNLDVFETRNNSTTPNAMVLFDTDNLVLNDLIIRENAILDMNGSNITVGGDFMNYGIITMDGPSWNSGGARRFTLNGSGDQTIYIKEDIGAPNQNGGNMSAVDNEAFYELIINKDGGNVILDNMGDNPNYSNITIRNRLEFNGSNQAIIDARTNDCYVEIEDQTGGDLAELFKFGDVGWIDGLLIKTIEDADQTLVYEVGTDAYYTPLTVEIDAADISSAGKVEAQAFGYDPNHLICNDEGINLQTNIRRYWKFEETAGSSFSLTPAGDYDLTLQFVEDDFDRAPDPTPNWTIFNLFTFPEPTEPAPTPPCNVNYTQLPNTGDRSDTDTEGLDIDFFGYFMVCELVGTKYYSLTSGVWTDPNSWSNDHWSAGTRTPASEYPGQTSGSDEAYIGNGDRITLTVMQPTVNSCVIEEYNGLPGQVYISDGSWIEGNSFLLNDECTLASADPNGIGAQGSGNFGSVRTTERIFGNSRYIYNASNTSQSIGSGLPDEIQYLEIDNTAPPGVALVSITNNDELFIEDSLNVNDGEFDSGPGIERIRLAGELIRENDTEFFSTNRPYEFMGSDTQYMILNDPDGISFYQLYIDKPGARDSVVVTGSATEAEVTVQQRLRFSATNQAFIKVRDDRRVTMEIDLVQRLGGSPYGHVDGIMQKPVPTGAISRLYEIGYGEKYTPATLTWSAGTGDVAGDVWGVNLAPLPDEYTNNKYNGHRVDPATGLQRYWRFDSLSVYQKGTRTLNIELGFPIAEYNGLDIDSTFVRRKSNFAGDAMQWIERQYDPVDLDFRTDATSGFVELEPTADPWPGLGDFYVGERFIRTFYSLNDGPWEDSNSWTFDSTHTGPPVPPGEFPNPSIWDTYDNVEIGYWKPGYEHEITLNTAKPDIHNVKIWGDGLLDLQTNGLNSYSGTGFFDLEQNGTLSFAGTNTPNTTLISSFDNYFVGENSTIEFYGDNQTLPGVPFGLPYGYGNVLIDQNGTKFVDQLTLVRNNVYTENGSILQILNANSLQVQGSVVNCSSIINDGVIEIGQ